MTITLTEQSTALDNVTIASDVTTRTDIDSRALDRLTQEICHDIGAGTYDGVQVIVARGGDIVLDATLGWACLLYTSPSPRDLSTSRMPSSA